jgi:hypothetical protein
MRYQYKVPGLNRFLQSCHKFYIIFLKLSHSVLKWPSHSAGRRTTDDKLVQTLKQGLQESLTKVSSIHMQMYMEKWCLCLALCICVFLWDSTLHNSSYNKRSRCKMYVYSWSNSTKFTWF